MTRLVCLLLLVLASASGFTGKTPSRSYRISRRRQYAKNDNSGLDVSDGGPRSYKISQPNWKDKNVLGIQDIPVSSAPKKSPSPASSSESSEDAAPATSEHAEKKVKKSYTKSKRYKKKMESSSKTDVEASAAAPTYEKKLQNSTPKAKEAVMPTAKRSDAKSDPYKKKKKKMESSRDTKTDKTAVVELADPTPVVSLDESVEALVSVDMDPVDVAKKTVGAAVSVDMDPVNVAKEAVLPIVTNAQQQSSPQSSPQVKARIIEELRLPDNEELRTRLIAKLMSSCDKYKEEQKRQWGLSTLSATGTSEGIFGSQSRAEDSMVLNKYGDEVIHLVEEVAKLNTNKDPLLNWGAEKGKGESCMLHGLWKLRFTTAADATFKPGKRGSATTSQFVNATARTLTNVIEFKENNGTVRNFNVIVEGERLSNNELALKFKKVVINRSPRKRFMGFRQKLFSKITIPLPSFGFLERFTRRKGEEKHRRKNEPGFEIIYLDEDLRIHRTTQGQLFVQSRLYDIWDPSEETGWKTVTAI